MKARQQFEKELKNKLALKTNGKQSEEAVILKAFKYFDLDNSGECDKNEWTKAIAKLGITGFSEKQLNEIFTAYDQNQNGQLDYKEFVSAVYSDTPNESVQNSGKKEHEHGAEEIDEETKQKLHNSKVMQKFREKILARGGKGIIGLARQFKIFDDNNSKTLDLPELTKAIKDFRVDLSNNEIKILFNILDPDGCGEIKYDDFLREIRGDMNDFRKNLVNKAFSKLDKDNSGHVDLDEIKSLYNCKKHPDVINGKKTEEEVYLEFMETFETHAAIKGIGLKGDSKISRAEFQEYYENISASIDRDDYFELMMNNAWKLDKQPDYVGKKAWTDKDTSGTKQKLQENTRTFQSATKKKTNPFGQSDETFIDKKSGVQISGKEDGTPVERFRAAVARRGVRGIMSIRRSFMIADDNNDKTIDKNEFKKLCKDYRMPLDDKEIAQCFTAFDRDRSGVIDYDEFLKGIVGDMNKFRKAIVKKAFDKLDKNKNGTIELDDIRGVYNASKHPDVKAGKKTEDEVLAEFLDVFEYHFSLLNENKSKNRSISLEEFEEYYNNISMSIDRDDYFELMMNNAWNLDGSRVTKKGWKGEY